MADYINLFSASFSFPRPWITPKISRNAFPALVFGWRWIRARNGLGNRSVTRNKHAFRSWASSAPRYRLVGWSRGGRSDGNAMNGGALEGICSCTHIYTILIELTEWLFITVVYAGGGEWGGDRPYSIRGTTRALWSGGIGIRARFSGGEHQRTTRGS
jgi:hypothetical protein